MLLNTKIIFVISAGKFDEDGSFIGQYGTLQRQKMQQAAKQAMNSNLQIYSKSAAGGTYV